MVEKTTFDDLVKLMQGNKIHRCPKCGGSGTIIKRVNRAQYWERCADYVEKEVTCDLCNGEGYTEKNIQTQNGTGWMGMQIAGKEIKDECSRCGNILECELFRQGHGIKQERENIAKMIECQRSAGRKERNERTESKSDLPQTDYTDGTGVHSWIT